MYWSSRLRFGCLTKLNEGDGRAISKLAAGLIERWVVASLLRVIRLSPGARGLGIKTR